MLRLPNELLIQCREVFRECPQFENYNNLKSFFISVDLFPFRFGIREANNPDILINLFLDYILSQTHQLKGPVFPLFLAELRDYYDPANRLFGQLDELHKKVTVIAEPFAHSAVLPQTRHQLFELLHQLDFLEQVRMVKNVIKNEYTAAFLIHGPPEYGQRFLSYRLSHLRPEWETGRHIIIDAGSPIVGISIRSLWREVAKRLECSPDTEHQILAQLVCDWRKTQDVIFVFHTIDYIPSPVLASWVDEFWKLLVSTARENSNTNSSNHHLLLFLVDYKGSVRKEGLNVVELPEKVSETHAPLSLPYNSRIPEEELDRWITQSTRLLPPSLSAQSLLADTDDGIPDLVYEKVCKSCGISWEGEMIP